jgi:hypothetical protein
MTTFYILSALYITLELINLIACKMADRVTAKREAKAESKRRFLNALLWCDELNKS